MYRVPELTYLRDMLGTKSPKHALTVGACFWKQHFVLSYTPLYQLRPELQTEVMSDNLKSSFMSKNPIMWPHPLNSPTGGGGVSRDPQKWLRNMCTTPYTGCSGRTACWPGWVVGEQLQEWECQDQDLNWGIRLENRPISSINLQCIADVWNSSKVLDTSRLPKPSDQIVYRWSVISSRRAF